MRYFSEHKIKNIGEQAAALKTHYPEFKIKFHKEDLWVSGFSQPTPMSCTYNFELSYHLKQSPEIVIVSPSLVRNQAQEKIPHMYHQKYLCLYHPNFGEFRYSYLIALTIIPWISLWLYYYESWHSTGEWLGGGIHPEN